jgi:lysophospholipase L1-like esterase
MPLTGEVAVNRVAVALVSLAILVSTLAQHPVSARPYQTRVWDHPQIHVAVIGDSYTTGTDEGGEGPNAWTARAWQALGRQGLAIAADVAAEGQAGYGVRGDHGSVFMDLTARAVHSDDALVVFFGSRNDQGVAPVLLGEMVRNTFDLARHTAPTAKLLVIGPPWPTADVPDSVRQIRDTLAAVARRAGATFADPIADRWFAGRPDLIGEDGVHPNDAGHAYLANKIAPLIGAEFPVL